jgi:tetratricopeptide (TPR) repeat protein
MGNTVKRLRWTLLLALAMSMLFSAVAAADEREISVEVRAEAADAYDQGTSAYLSERYELAAHWFERAFRLVPTSTALLQAVRAHEKAGDSIRAANLALQLTDSYPSDERAKQIADVVIASVKPVSVMVAVECATECTLELDGALIQHPTFFVTPDVEHSLKAAFDKGEASAYVQGAPGDIKAVTLVPPALPAAPPIPRWAFFSSLGATVALGAVTIWSGIDANNGVSAYESAARSANSPGINNGASPSPEAQAQSLLDDGQAKERRTNILIGVTAGMAATTAVLGVFTNWKGESSGASKRIEPAIGVSTRGGGMTIKGRF